MSAGVVRGKSMARIRRVLLVWWVALAVGGATAAVAGPAEDVVLLSAATHGDAAAVLALLDKGAGVNARDNDGATALLAASRQGYLDVVLVLLAKGAEVNAKDNKGVTALMVASATGQLDIVQALLAKGADINAKAPQGYTALMAASGTGHLEIVRALLAAKGVDVNAKDNDGTTALMLACREGNLGLVQALLTHGADVDAKATDGKTALSAATDARHDDVKALLMQMSSAVHLFPGAPSAGAAPAHGTNVAPPTRTAIETTPFIGTWQLASSLNCDYRLAK